MKYSFSFPFILIITIFLIGCSSDNNNQQYSASDLTKIHGGNSKTWVVENFYDNFEFSILSPFNDCYKDETFTFKQNTNEVTVDLGDTSCFFDTPTTEDAFITYSFHEEEGSIFISISRSEVLNGTFRSKFFILGLEELTENRMLFSAGEKGAYGKTIVFTSL